MEIETRNDIRLVGRAIRAGWDVDKAAIKDALMQVIRLGDPELIIDAAKVLLVADSIDCKREELEQKKKIGDNAERLRLIELARSIPVEELGRIASEHGLISQSK